MIRLSSELGSQVRDCLNRINNRFGFLDTSSNVSPKTMFTEEELDYIVDLKIGKNDIKYLSYFKNLECLEISLYPSLNDVDFSYISNRFNNLIGLTIANQNDITSIDLKNFNKLVNLNICDNDNLIDIKNINCCKELFRISIYNDKSLLNINSVYDLINYKSKLDMCELDISYFVDSINYLYKINKSISTFNMINWVENTGFRYKNYMMYSHSEMINIFKMATDSISKYIFNNDSNIVKFGIVYQWFVSNIRFLNNDNTISDDNALKVLKTGYGSRLTYAKAFQFVLSIVGIDSDIIYSIGAFDNIGMNNGMVMANLNGSSDYALLRVKIDGRHYFCDIAWDSLIFDQNYYDNLKLVLVSSDELKIRHNIVNNLADLKSASYSYKDTSELLDFVIDRINNINNMISDIEQYKKNISSLEYEIIKLDDKIDDFKFDKELVLDTENKKKSLELELKDYLSMRDNIIFKYRKNIVGQYLDIPDNHILTVDEVNENNELIGKLNEYCFLSNYIYRLISYCLKDTI